MSVSSSIYVVKVSSHFGTAVAAKVTIMTCEQFEGFGNNNVASAYRNNHLYFIIYFFSPCLTMASI
jgi:hypothetical protein